MIDLELASYIPFLLKKVMFLVVCLLIHANLYLDINSIGIHSHTVSMLEEADHSVT